MTSSVTLIFNNLDHGGSFFPLPQVWDHFSCQVKYLCYRTTEGLCWKRLLKLPVDSMHSHPLVSISSPQAWANKVGLNNITSCLVVEPMVLLLSLHHCTHVNPNRKQTLCFSHQKTNKKKQQNRKYKKNEGL